MIPTRPDGFSMSQLMAGSLLAALAAPIALIIVFMELDTRIKSESRWSEEWPALVGTIPPMKEGHKRRISDLMFVCLFAASIVLVYGSVGASLVLGYI